MSKTSEQVPPPPPIRRRITGWFARHWGPIVALGGLGVIVVLLVLIPTPNHDEKPTPRPPAPVSMIPVVPVETLIDDFEISGSIEANRQVPVPAESAARIDAFAGRQDRVTEELKVVPGPVSAGILAEGDRVEVGQPLMYLNRDIVRANMRIAEADYKHKLAEYTREKRLFEGGYSSDAALDQARTAFESAEAVRMLRGAELDRSIVRAPIAGTVDRIPVEVGEYVTPGTPVAYIVDVETVKIVVGVPERDIAYLSVGDEVEIHYGAFPGKTFKGNISYISKVASQGTRTTRVEISVANPLDDEHKRSMLVGKIVKVRLPRRVLHDVIMAPLRAIIPMGPQADGRNAYVAYVARDGKAVRCDVRIDSSLLRDDKVAVTQGLSAGDRLIVDARMVGPGQAVRLADQDTLPPDIALAAAPLYEESASESPASSQPATQPESGQSDDSQ